MRRGIAVAGTLVLDRVKTIDAWPAEERLANVLAETHSGGGAVYNVLTDLALMKAPFPLRAIGVVGEDPAGRWLIGDLARRRIDISGISTTREAPTSFTDVMTVSSSGRRTFFHHRGANRLLEGSQVEPAACRILHLAYLLLMDRIDPQAASLLSRIRASGVKTSVDVVSEIGTRFREVVTPVLDHVDYLILNEIEAGAISGHKIRRDDGSLDRDALRESARALHRHNVVAIHMPEGGWVNSSRGEIFGEAKPVTAIRSTVGAGDAFCAGMLYGLHEAWAIDRTLDLALRAAAACLSHETATGGLRALGRQRRQDAKKKNRKGAKTQRRIL